MLKTIAYLNSLHPVWQENFTYSLSPLTCQNTSFHVFRSSVLCWNYKRPDVHRGIWHQVMDRWDIQQRALSLIFLPSMELVSYVAYVCLSSWLPECPTVLLLQWLTLPKDHWCSRASEMELSYGGKGRGQISPNCCMLCHPQENGCP